MQNKIVVVNSIEEEISNLLKPYRNRFYRSLPTLIIFFKLSFCNLQNRGFLLYTLGTSPLKIRHSFYYTKQNHQTTQNKNYKQIVTLLHFSFSENEVTFWLVTFLRRCWQRKVLIKWSLQLMFSYLNFSDIQQT